MIVKMLHLDLVCLAAEKDKTLTQLRDLGAVHLDLSSAQGATVAAAKGEAADAEKAVRLILKARGKAKDVNIHERSVADILAIDADRESLRSDKDELEREIRVYEPYGDFDPELAEKLLGEVEGLRDVVPLPETLPSMSLSKMREKLERIENCIVVDEAKLAGSDEKAILKKYPALADKIAFEEAKELVGEQGELAYVSGWIPEPARGTFAAAVHENGWGALLREPADGEIPPTLIDPPKLFRPVTALFSGLGIAPAYTESDVSVPFFCYFTIFFAMLVGDGGYGALILALTIFGWFKTRNQRTLVAKSWLTLLTVFSSATVLWGLLSNTWFGAGIPWCADWPTVKWLADPSYKNMMLLCFTIGVSHLMIARIWTGITIINDRRCLAQFGWAGVVLFMYLVTNSIVGIFSGIPTWAFWMFGVSLVLVFGFTLKGDELKTRGVELGMLPLNIMSALGDVISYVRLFAVGLASVKVAENFNDMALSIFNCTDMIWLKPVTAIGMILVLLIGHGLNFAMAGLSILVHAVRLNTLEFSNHKGVTWAGYAFSPFRKTST
jgi:V/A-type H+-transporting ATPase subunit I